MDHTNTDPLSFDEIRTLFPSYVDEEFVSRHQVDRPNKPLARRAHTPKKPRAKPRLHGHKASNILYTLRAAKGITQAELATTAGVNRQTINEIENLRSAPSVYTVIAIAQTLGIKIEDIFKLRD